MNKWVKFILLSLPVLAIATFGFIKYFNYSKTEVTTIQNSNIRSLEKAPLKKEEPKIPEAASGRNEVKAYRIYKAREEYVYLATGAEKLPDTLIFLTSSSAIKGIRQEVETEVDDSCGESQAIYLDKYKLTDLTRDDILIAIPESNIEIENFDRDKLVPTENDTAFLSTELISYINDEKDLEEIIKSCTTKKYGDFEEVNCPTVAFLKYKGQLVTKNTSDYGGPLAEIHMILRINDKKYFVVKSMAKLDETFSLILEDDFSTRIHVIGSTPKSC